PPPAQRQRPGTVGGGGHGPCLRRPAEGKALMADEKDEKVRPKAEGKVGARRASPAKTEEDVGARRASPAARTPRKKAEPEEEGPLSVPAYDANGERSGRVRLPEAVFGQQPNMAVMHQAYVRQ